VTFVSGYTVSLEYRAFGGSEKDKDQNTERYRSLETDLTPQTLFRQD